MNHRFSGVIPSWAAAGLAAGVLMFLPACESDGGDTATIDQQAPIVGPQPGPQPPPPGTPTQTTFSPQEAAALILAIQNGEKQIGSLTDHERFILAAIAAQERERRERRRGG